MLKSSFVVLGLLKALAYAASLPERRWENDQWNTPDPSSPCGFVLTKYDNAYYPYYRRVTFEHLPSGPLKSANGLESVGFDISDDIFVGGTGPGNTTTVGHYYNIAVDKSGGQAILRLKVPGGQHAPGNLSGAEMHTSQAFTGGVFTAEVQIDKTVGTDQAVVSETRTV